MEIQWTDLVENIFGKEEIACFEQFLLFPQCFQELFVGNASKWVSMEKMVKPVLETTCIKPSSALRDHCSDTTPLLNSV